MSAREIEADICVIGAGAGGLSVAAGAAQLGQRVVLVERDLMGGDCLNHGCVPSKALLAAAAAAQAAREARRFGVEAGPVRVDRAALRAHLRGVIDAIAPHDSQERFEGLGVTVLRAHARFRDRDSVEAGDAIVRARRFVVATGSAPAVPPIPGLASLPFLTNESVFDLAEAPRRLLVLGGGPIGCELGQAHRRLGSEVVVLEARALCGREDPELVEVLRQRLRAEGVELREGASVVAARRAGDDVALRVARADGGEEEIEGSHLLVAAGRRPRLDDLGLERAGIEHDARGIRVDAGLRTTNRRVHAIGDAAGGAQFTHLAGHHAGIFVRRALFRLPARADAAAIPRVTYTDPEIAWVGMTEEEARMAGHAPRILRAPFSANDRARAERDEEGLVKVVAGARGRILGAGIAGARAGDLLQPWILAIAKRLSLRDMAGLVLPYPTRGEASKRAASSYFADALFSPRTRRLVRWLSRLG
jgi:pyruvate/2-oxoglutarate dehydrogenase complex dihydrolipoamide dehydrogenase (E3) component